MRNRLAAQQPTLDLVALTLGMRKVALDRLYPPGIDALGDYSSMSANSRPRNVSSL